MNQLSDFFKDVLSSKQNKWLIRRNDSSLDLDTCAGVATYDERTRTCELCVALNNTIFLSNNLPKYQHPYCKCKYNEVYLYKVDVDFRVKKLTDYLFLDVNKYAMVRSMGYDVDDVPLIYAKIFDNIAQEFLNGNYKIKSLDKYGQRIGVNFILEGKRHAQGKAYKCHTGCVVYPNGNLYVTTPLIKDKEIKKL